MGIFKIHNASDKSIYIFYQVKKSNQEILLYLLDDNDNSYYLKITTDSTVIREWAKTLKQTTENYLQQLHVALKEQSMQNLHPSKSENENLKVDNKNSSSKENVFEVDGGDLIWKQFFKSGNIIGKKGKFLLEKKPRQEVLAAFMESLISESNEKDCLISHLESENRRAITEKQELHKIAEDSVKMKENFENEIYGKFSVLLNNKKKKNMELQQTLMKMEKNGQVPSSSSQSMASKSRREINSEDEYDVDTDIDSPEEIIEDTSHTSLKREGSKGTPRDAALAPKRSKNLEIEVLDDSQNSEDLLNASLESDFKSIGFSGRNFKRIV